MNTAAVPFEPAKLYTMQEVARVLGCSVASVYRWRRRHKLAASGPSRRTLFITGEELAKLFKSRPAPK
jgi:transposase-like protein